VPGWHQVTESYRKDGKIKLVGIIQEQHPERARLFMQWKQMHWPIMVDALNLLYVSAVPIVLLIDEFGIVRQVNPRLSEAKNVLEQFVNSEYNVAENQSRALKADSNLQFNSESAETATELVLWDSPAQIDAAISLYKKAISETPDIGDLYFKLGVTYRMRYDLASQKVADFQLAVKYWLKALEINPNQYIWRRRIQQYGPRMDKPYPFYDWIFKARQEIIARGEKPSKLLIEPGGAEYAQPDQIFQRSESNSTGLKNEPDSAGKISLDQGELIKISSVVVPATSGKIFTARVHLEFRPVERIKVNWNNEAADLLVWLNPPPGWEVSPRQLTFPNPPQAVTGEVRKLEFELKSSGKSPASTVTIPAYALYYVCEGVNGTCLYRRQNILIQVRCKN